MNPLVYQILWGIGILCFLVSQGLSYTQPVLINQYVVKDYKKRNDAKTIQIPAMVVARCVFGWVAVSTFLAGCIAYIISTKTTATVKFL